MISEFLASLIRNCGIVVLLTGVATAHAQSSLIAVHPQGVNTVTGQPALLRITPATSASLNYQWRFNGQPIAGATGATYVISSASVHHSGAYDVIVSNGTLQNRSNPAELNVAPSRYPTTMGIDPSFAPRIEAGGAFIYVIQRQDDGKLLIGGDFTTVDGVSRRNLARLLPDGSVDLSFDPGTGPDGTVRAIAVQADGKILLGGAFTRYEAGARSRIARVNADGSLDASFNPGAGANNDVLTVALFGDGGILVAGAFTEINGTSRRSVARLTVAGAVDPIFDVGAGPTGAVSAAIALPQNKALIGGGFNHFNGRLRNGLARINSNGTLDETFVLSLPAGSEVASLRRQPDGKVLVGTANFGVTGNELWRLNDNGAVDSSFRFAGGANQDVFAFDLLPDGRIMIGGFFTTYDGVPRSRLARLHSNGILDNTFVPPAINLSVHAIALQSGGRPVIGGRFHAIGGVSKSGLARLSVDAGLDPTFQTQVRTGGTVKAFVRQPDGRLLIGGSFSHVDGVARQWLARLAADGTLDRSFDPRMEFLSGATGATGSVESIVLQPDGKILLTGSFDTVNGLTRRRVARLHVDGTLDLTFNPGTSTTSSVSSVALFPDGKVLVAGSFTSFGGVARNRVVRLNPDGTLDPTFNPTPGSNGLHGVVRRALPLLDGRTLVGGWFSTFGGFATSGVARLMMDGTVDSTFSTGAIFGESGLETLHIAGDGTVFVGGSFHLAGNESASVGRLAANGELEQPFYRFGQNPVGRAGALKRQPDGKVLAAQHITSSSEPLPIGLARYVASGALDTTFSVTGLQDAKASEILLMDDGTLLLAGGRFQDGIVDRAGVVRLGHPTAPRISSDAALNFTVGRRNNFLVTATGVPGPTFSVVEGALPGWASLHPTRGIITGTPPLGTRGSVSFILRARNGVGAPATQAFTLSFDTLPVFAAQPSATRSEVGSAVILTADAQGVPAPTYQWRKDDVDIVGATAATLTLGNFQLGDAGAYSVVATNRAGAIASDAIVAGVISPDKISGLASEVATDVLLPLGNTYDQVLLHGTQAMIAADRGQVTRLSFVDFSDDIVQVEFSGAGTLTLMLEGAAGPMPPTNYNQDVAYMKGHARIVIAEADESTNVSVFSVGRQNAVNQALFKDTAHYDGFADLASISIASRNGKFGGLRAANASFFATRGIAGVHAPNVAFTGPVYVGDITGVDTATATFIIGASAKTPLIAGGDLLQPNGRAVQVKGFTALQFGAGTTSHGVSLTAQRNRGILESDGLDVTDQVAVNP